MMIKNIVQTVHSVQQGEKEKLMNLIENFMPLLRKYSNFLRDEDGFGDLVVFFIEKIYAIDVQGFENPNGNYVMISYFNRCIRNHYIFLSKQKARRNTIGSVRGYGRNINCRRL